LKQPSEPLSPFQVTQNNVIPGMTSLEWIRFQILARFIKPDEDKNIQDSSVIM